MRRTNKIRLTESQLNRVIKESVNKVLNEEENYDYDGNWEECVRHEKFNLEDLESKVPFPYRASIHQMVVELDSFLDDANRKREWENWNN